MQIQIKQSEVLSVNYEVQGNGFDVVLLHGLGLSSMKTWTNQVSELSKYYCIHTYDVRGFGATNNPLNRFSVQQHAYDLYALLKELNLKNICLVGFSMGGWIAQQFILDHPEMVSVLILSCATSGLRPEGAKRFIDRSDKIDQHGIASLVEEQMANTFSPETFEESPDLINFYRENFLDEAQNNPRSYASMFRALTVTNWTAQLGRISCPTLIICGDSDRGITRGNTATDAAEILHRGIKNSQLAVIEGGGHYAHLEKSFEWNAIVKEFIDKVI